jgi:acyl-CoA dehydrogenase
MDFELSDELKEVQQWTREFCAKNCPPDYIRKLDAAGEFPHELYQRMADAGFLAISAAEADGGAGGDIMTQAVVCEELSHGMQGTAMSWFTTSCFGAQSVGAYGTPEQRRRLVPGICDGSVKFSLSITEPGGGTDVLGAMQTRAARVDGGWKLTGSKVYTTAAHVADYILVACRTAAPEGSKKHKGVTALLVERDQSGVAMEPLPLLSLNTIESFAVSYDGVLVADHNVLGEAGEGWKVLTHTLNNERILTAAMCVGIGRAAFEDALAYAKERQAFGRPIGQFQSIANYLVEMKVNIEQSRLMTYKAAWMQSRGLPCGPEATAAVLVASKMVNKVADDGIQVMGGMGLSYEADMQRYWRDTRQLRIGPISNEMAANYIASTMGLPKSY